MTLTTVRCHNLLNSWRFPLLLLLLIILLHGQTAHAEFPTATVNVDFTKSVPVSSTIGAMGMTLSEPSDKLIRKSGIKRIRFGNTGMCVESASPPFDSASITHGNRTWNPAIIRRATGLQVESILIVGSVWNCLHPEGFPFSQPGGWDVFDALLRELAPKLKNLGVRIVDVWNEPTNLNYHDRNGTVWSPANLAYATSRVSKFLGPDFIIMGPSFDPSAFRIQSSGSCPEGAAMPYVPGTPCPCQAKPPGKWAVVREYLDQLVCQNGRLDQLSWHPLSDDLAQSMVADGNFARTHFIDNKKYSSLGFKAPYINLNEIVPKSTIFNPAAFLRLYAAVEELKVDAVLTLRGNYAPPQNPNPHTNGEITRPILSSLIDPVAQTPLPTFWAHSAYAASVPARVYSNSHASQINVLASRQEILISNFNWNPGMRGEAISASINGNPQSLPEFTGASNIELSFYSYLNGLGAVGEPVFLKRVVYALPKRRDFSFPIVIPWEGTIQIRLKPTSSPVSPWAIREAPLTFITYTQSDPQNQAQDSNCSYLSFNPTTGFLLGCNRQRNLTRVIAIGNDPLVCNSMRIVMTNNPADWPRTASSEIHRDTARSFAPNGAPEMDYMRFLRDRNTFRALLNDDEDTNKLRDYFFKDMIFTLETPDGNYTIQNAELPCH